MKGNVKFNKLFSRLSQEKLSAHKCTMTSVIITGRKMTRIAIEAHNFCTSKTLHPKISNAKICTASYFLDMYSEIWQMRSLLFFSEKKKNAQLNLFRREWPWGGNDLTISNRRTLLWNSRSRHDVISSDLKLPNHWLFNRIVALFLRNLCK